MSQIRSILVLVLTAFSLMTCQRHLTKTGLLFPLPLAADSVIAYQARVEVNHAPNESFGEDKTITNEGFRAIYPPPARKGRKNRVVYDHYIVLSQQKDTITCHELFKSEQREQLLTNTFSFVPNDSLLVFHRAEDYWNFGEFAKLFFLFQQTKKDQSIRLHFPQRVSTDTSIHQLLRRDSSFQSLIKIRGNEERIDSLSIRYEAAKPSQPVTVSLHLELSNTFTVIQPVPQFNPSHQDTASKKINWRASIDQMGFYKIIEYREFNSSGLHRSAAAYQKTAVYRRLQHLPPEIQRALEKQ